MGLHVISMEGILSSSEKESASLVGDVNSLLIGNVSGPGRKKRKKEEKKLHSQLVIFTIICMHSCVCDFYDDLYDCICFKN